MQRERYVEVECIVVDDTDKEVEHNHEDVLVDGDYGTYSEEVRHKYKSFQRNKEELDKRDNISSSRIISVTMGACVHC